MEIIIRRNIGVNKNIYYNLNGISNGNNNNSRAIKMPWTELQKYKVTKDRGNRGNWTRKGKEVNACELKISNYICKQNGMNISSYIFIAVSFRNNFVSVHKITEKRQTVENALTVPSPSVPYKCDGVAEQKWKRKYWVDNKNSNEMYCYC